MTDKKPIVIKKYANRRLYNTGSSTYVTLEDLAVMVKDGDEFTVQDAKSGEDITRSVLTQIIFDQEAKEGQSMLPANFLRQLIKFYGDSMQNMVPSYLEHSMNAFAREQEKMREQMAKAFGGMNMMEDQVRRNMEMFQSAMSMFMPFGAGADAGKPEEKPGSAAGSKESELSDLKQQLADMKDKLDRLG